ncbi:MAG TPA: LptF/LptG family permease [Pirellulales bacterium]|jgi:lipopolysaccharide export system permease protein|nr:LptF/LptG family permease [Pirellulales bacterium]
MRIIQRYVIAEVLKIFAVTLAMLTVMMIVVVLLREARDQGLEARQILKILPFLLPEAMRYTVPATILFAVSSVYGRISGANELIALKSLGISPMRILWPVFLLSVAISVATVWLNDVAVSWGRSNMRRVVVESVEEIVYGMLRTKRAFTSPAFSIIVKRVDRRRLIEPTITIRGSGSSPGVTLTAEDAELWADTKTNLLTISCTRGTLDVEGEARLRFDDPIDYAIPLDSASQMSGDVQPSQLALAALPQLRREHEAKLEQANRHRAVKAAFNLMTGEFAMLGGSESQRDAQQLLENRFYLYRLMTEPYRRWAGGFSCLCFVLIGAPVAILMRNSDFLKSFCVCFLPILGFYYPFLLVGVDQAKSGNLPPISVWLGNIVLACVGAWITRRYVMRH